MEQPMSKLQVRSPRSVRTLLAPQQVNEHAQTKLAHPPLLDSVYEKLRLAQRDDGTVDEAGVWEAMDELVLGLQARRLHGTERAWEECVADCLAHPLREWVHQDPFTRRAFTKPRGYAGDAVLLDFIYGKEERWPVPEGTTPLGRAIFNYTTSAPAPAGVRARREVVAKLLDRLAEEVHRPHVLSVAAGHLREALLSSAVKRRKIGRLVALDADAQSLAEVRGAYGCYGVEVLPASFRQMLTGAVQLGTFDLVYATGLFDYLPQKVAQQLTWALFGMLRPRGRLTVANFLPGIRDIGYMESYMGWKLLYRTRQQMLEVAERIPEAEVEDVRLYSEENRNILFLQVTRR
jgi:hypothetical protein